MSFHEGPKEDYWLGFFSLGNTPTWYLGIAYNQPFVRLKREVALEFEDPTEVRGYGTSHSDISSLAGKYGNEYIAKYDIVWIANRNIPIDKDSGILTIDEYGKLKILSPGISPVILSSIETPGNVTATLLDTGNFVLKEESGGRVLWQSFDYPTNTLLPGMKLGINFKTGHTTLLTSWKNSNVPASGSYTLGLDPNGSAQLMIWWQGEIIWRSGLWSEDHFEHVPKQSYHSSHSFSFVSLQNESSYFTYSVKRKYTFPRYRMGYDGFVYESEGVAPFGACVYSSRYVNVEGDYVYQTSTEDEPGCVDIHGKRPYCRIHDYIRYDVNRRRGFIYGLGFKYKNSNLSIYDCMESCFKNCSCVAFSYINDDQTGCEIWNEDMEFLANEEYHYKKKLYYLRMFPLNLSYFR